MVYGRGRDETSWLALDDERQQVGGDHLAGQLDCQPQSGILNDFADQDTLGELCHVEHLKHQQHDSALHGKVDTPSLAPLVDLLGRHLLDWRQPEHELRLLVLVRRR
jgi:hypothetical protein